MRKNKRSLFTEITTASVLVTAFHSVLSFLVYRTCGFIWNYFSERKKNSDQENDNENPLLMDKENCE